MKRFAPTVGLFAAFICTANAQTPSQSQIIRQQQQQRFYQAAFYQQLAGQQLLYPTPASPYAARLSYLQYVNQLNRTAAVGNLSRISAVDSARIDTYLRASSLWQYSWYPQTISASYYMPMNVLQLASGRTGPFPPALPTDTFTGLETMQHKTVNFVGETVAVYSSVMNSQYGAATSGLQTALFNGIKRANAIAQANAAPRRGNDGSRRGEIVASLFREGPGERELELGQLWTRVDKEKARVLFQQAIDQAGADANVADQARKELKALDGK